MPTYQRAYPLERLRRFPGWDERTTTPTDALSGDTIVFVREDRSVSLGCFDGDEILFSSTEPDWEAFCTTELGFEIPDWEAESQRVRAHLAAELAQGTGD